MGEIANEIKNCVNLKKIQNYTLTKIFITDSK